MATGNELYAWQVQEPDGAWSMIAAATPGQTTLMPMVHRDRKFLERLQWMAEAHAKATGQPLRFASFVMTDSVEYP